MVKEFARLGLAVLMGVGLAAGGCTKEQSAGDGGGTSGAAAAGGTSGTSATKPAGAAGGSMPPADATAAAPATTPAAATEPGLNPLFTLPPSKGPAPHQFRQVTLLRSGPSGDLEMQLTGDGIYRIRDHGRGRSYAGSGKLEEQELAEWAAVFKDWDALKDSYLPDDGGGEKADKVEIIYGGKKVAASPAAKDNPKPFADAYARLLALNDQSKKESGVTDEPAKETAVPAGSEGK